MKTAKEWEEFIAVHFWPAEPKSCATMGVIIQQIQRDAMEAMREAAAKAAEETETADVSIKCVLYDDAAQTLLDAAKAIRAIDIERLLGGGA